MAPVLTEADIHQAVELHRAGESLKQIAAPLGVHPDTLSRAIRDAGIEFVPNRHNREKRAPVIPEAIERYGEGESVLALSREYGVSRGAITRWIREAGLPVRGRSDAGKTRAGRMSAAERSAQAAAAHEAARGRDRSREEMLQRALTVRAATLDGIRQRSRLEVQLGEWLTERGVRFVPEEVADVYNVDFAIGSVAVELLGGSWHAQPARRDHHRHRTHQILNAGWHMIFVWSTHYGPIDPRAADQIVALSEQASGLPATPGQYWVIRGDGQVTATGSGERDDFTLELPSQSGMRGRP